MRKERDAENNIEKDHKKNRRYMQIKRENDKAKLRGKKDERIER